MSNRFAIVENGVVVNVVIGTSQLAENQIIVECPNAGPGWKYVDGQFVAPDPELTAAPQPTKEELLAQLKNLQEQINALL